MQNPYLALTPDEFEQLLSDLKEALASLGDKPNASIHCIGSYNADFELRLVHKRNEALHNKMVADNA